MMDINKETRYLYFIMFFLIISSAFIWTEEQDKKMLSGKIQEIIMEHDSLVMKYNNLSTEYHNLDVAYSYLESYPYVRRNNSYEFIENNIFNYSNSVTCIQDHCSIIYDRKSLTISTPVGISMIQTIPPGAKVIKTTEFDKLNIPMGSMIIFEKLDKSNFIIHRVINECEGGYITRGDNNIVDDGCVSYDQIKTIVLGVIY